MPKKLFILAVAAVLLLVSAFIPGDGSTAPAVFEQHLSWPGQSEETTGLDENGVLSTHLPIVIIEADGHVIPGANAADRRKLTCSYSIIHNKNGVNRSDAPPTQTGLIDISIRGNSSRRFPKKQYGIRTVDDARLPVDTAMLGMPPESTWVLNGSYIDRSMIRNYMLYNICGKIMDYAPRCRLCEVMLTGLNKKPVYQGVYSMIEKPRVSGARLPLAEYDPKYTETSFVLQMNSHIDKLELQHLKPDELMAYSFDLEYPNPEIISDASRQYVENEVLTLQKMLYDADYTGHWENVLDVIDLDSFVDYFLINEFFQNYDAGIRSTYIYRNMGGKYHLGPVWDFDGTFSNFNGLNFGTDVLNLKTTYFYYYLSQCPAFVNQCSRRYQELRRSYLSNDYLIAYMDECSAYLADAAARNCDKWYGGNLNRFLHDIDDMKEFVVERGAWMDAYFRQASAIIH